MQVVPYPPQVQYVQPMQPQFHRRNAPVSSTPAVKMASGIQSYMKNKQMHKVPSFTSYNSGTMTGFALIYFARQLSIALALKT